MHNASRMARVCAALTLALFVGTVIGNAQTAGNSNGFTPSHSLKSAVAGPSSFTITPRSSKALQVIQGSVTASTPPKPAAVMPEPRTLTMLLGSLLFGGLVFGLRRQKAVNECACRVASNSSRPVAEI